MHPYNTKLISSCPKQTSNSVWAPEMAKRAMEAPATLTVAIRMAIAETADLVILHP